MNTFQRMREYIVERQIILALAFAIIVALVMTFVSLKLYDLDDVSRLDVSLPNREGIRSSTDEEALQKFDSSGELDVQAISDFQSLYSKNRAALDALGKFDSDALSSDSLKIGPNE